MLVLNSEISAHRTSRTSADSGNDPTAWGDTPTFFSMSGHKVLRVYPSVTGTNVQFDLRVITQIGSTYHTSGIVSSGINNTELIDFTGYGGEAKVFVKIDALTGTSPVLTLKLSGVVRDA